MNELDLLMKVKNNSIGKEKKERIVTKTKEITKKTLVVLMLSLITLSTCACSSSINYQEVGLYNQRQSIVLAEYFEQNNMSFYQPNHTIEQYMGVQEILNENDVLLYYDKLGEDECNKILILLGYKDMNDFLIKNQYVNEQGEPDMGVFRRTTYERITEEMVGKKK